MSKRMYHPCHKLSVPSAKLFWCRHCMQMFEDAIARWKHSKKCHASPGYKHKDHDAKVIQLYVKPDTVSYTSNIGPGQAVYHKPHVKKTSTDLKCVICGTKFFSLHEMRNHVKEPCQRSDFKQSVASTQSQFSDNEDDTESFSSLKIRRVESEDEEKISANTALSVLAEASKHVESLSHGDIIIEQVIEEEVPQVVDNYPHISQTVGDTSGLPVTSSVPVYQDSLTFETKPDQEVIVAYPRPTAKPELGTVVVLLQSEDGNQIPQDFLDLDTIQESLRETALTLPVGQIIQIQCGSNEKVLQFIVGFQGVIWPLEDNQSPHLELKERTENAALFRSQPPSLQSTHPSQKEPLKEATSSYPQIVTNSVDINITNNIQVGFFGHPSDNSTVSPQEVIVTTEDISQKREICPQLLDFTSQTAKTNTNLITGNNTKIENSSTETNRDSTGAIIESGLIQHLLAGSQKDNSSELSSTKTGTFETKDIDLCQKPALQNLDPNTAPFIEVLLRSGAIVPQEEVPACTTDPVGVVIQEVWSLPSKSDISAQLLQSGLQECKDQVLITTVAGFLNTLLIFSSPEPKVQDTMACGKQLVDNLFGFAELTGEIVEKPDDDFDPFSCASANTKDYSKDADLGISKIEVQSDLIKRDENEVIVPIVFEKSGVKKFKVLARQMVEDDEDIRRPKSTERESPNSTEQRKENINIDKNLEKNVKHKSNESKSMKKMKGNVHSESDGKSLKSLKKLKLTSQKKHSENVYKKVDKKLVRKKQTEKKPVKLKPETVLKEKDEPIHKDSRKNDNTAKSCEAQSEINSANIKPKLSPKIVDECKTFKTERMSENCEKSRNVARVSSPKPSVKVECSVKLKRDPSIENLCKNKLEDEKLTSMEEVTDANEDKFSDCSDASQATKKGKTSDSMENLTVGRQLSSEECRQKTADMVFDANVQIRKSGRLQSAKCASRYRGDYGIRADTYKQLLSKKESVSVTGDETDDTGFHCPEIYEGSDSVYGDKMVHETDEQTRAEVASIVRECVKNASMSVDKIDMNNKPPCVVTSVTNEFFPSADKGLDFRSETNQNNSPHEGGELDRDNCVKDDRTVVSDASCEEGSLRHEICANANDITKSGNNPSFTSELVTKTVPCCSSMAGTDENPCKCDKHLVSCDTSCRDHMENVNIPTLTDNVEISSQKKEVSCGPDYIYGECVAKEFIAEKVLSFHKTETDCNNQLSGYVHSVGKSVKRKRVEIKKLPKSVNLVPLESSSPPESSPVKDPVAVLENLRLKLFEKAGADVIKADKSLKQFESALISSKRRECKKADNGNQSSLLVNVEIECSSSKDSDHLSSRSGKSTPRCITPRLDNNQQILEEVAQSLDILQKVKRKSEPVKRQKFEDKQFMLRSMVKKNKESVSNEPCLEEIKGSNDDDVESEKKVAKISSKSRSTRSSVDSTCSISSGDNTVINDVNVLPVSSQTSEGEKKSAPKSKTVTCSACGNAFKSRELMRKHFPCRVRQTRTWSQNKLRPNRAVKRTEACPKKFVCQLPKSGKSDANKHRPQLLTYRKTKFRRVKGKRRRRLYLLIQELKQKRQPVKWPHLGVIYDDLSFKEQSLYKLGLICIGQASEGLERYTADDITLFEQHRAKEKMISESTLNFQHSLQAESIESSLNDSISTDTTESENISSTNVINTSQESLNTTCESGSFNDTSTSEPYSSEAVVNTNIVISDKLETAPSDDCLISDRQEVKEIHELTHNGLFSEEDDFKVGTAEVERKIVTTCVIEDTAESSESSETKIDECSEMEVNNDITSRHLELKSLNGINSSDAEFLSEDTMPIDRDKHLTSLKDSGNECVDISISETEYPEVELNVELNQQQLVNQSHPTCAESFDNVVDVLQPDNDRNDKPSNVIRDFVCHESFSTEDISSQAVKVEEKLPSDSELSTVPQSNVIVDNDTNDDAVHSTSYHSKCIKDNEVPEVVKPGMEKDDNKCVNDKENICVDSCVKEDMSLQDVEGKTQVFEDPAPDKLSHSEILPNVVENIVVQSTSEFSKEYIQGKEVAEFVKLDNEENNGNEEKLMEKENMCLESYSVDEVSSPVVKNEGQDIEDLEVKVITFDDNMVTDAGNDLSHSFADKSTEYIQNENVIEIDNHISGSNKMETESNETNVENVKQLCSPHELKDESIDRDCANKSENPLSVQLTPTQNLLQSSVKKSPGKGSEMLISINRRKSKYAVSVATDIEFFHQTANIDKNVLTVEDQDKFDPKEKKQNADIDTILIKQASELLQDILGDVEQTVCDGSNGVQSDTTAPGFPLSKSAPSTPVETVSPLKKVFLSTQQNNNDFLSNTSTPVSSSLKSPLKNNSIQALREIDMISPVKVNESMFNAQKDGEKMNLTPPKKKIDFKTYAKRKNLMNMKEMEENEKEVHRCHSDSSELNDDFLHRLISAVHVIDSIIEDQKEGSENDAKDCFSAITPELACELASSKVKPKTDLSDEDCHPYDIESFPNFADDICNVSEKSEFDSCIVQQPSESEEPFVLTESDGSDHSMADGQTDVLSADFQHDLIDDNPRKTECSIDHDGVSYEITAGCKVVSDYFDCTEDASTKTEDVSESNHENRLGHVNEYVIKDRRNLAHFDVSEDTKLENHVDNEYFCADTVQHVECCVNSDKFIENNDIKGSVVNKISDDDMVIDKSCFTAEVSDRSDLFNVISIDSNNLECDLKEDTKNDAETMFENGAVEDSYVSDNSNSIDESTNDDKEIIEQSHSEEPSSSDFQSSTEHRLEKNLNDKVSVVQVVDGIGKYCTEICDNRNDTVYEPETDTKSNVIEDLCSNEENIACQDAEAVNVCNGDMQDNYELDTQSDICDSSSTADSSMVTVMSIEDKVSTDENTPVQIHSICPDSVGVGDTSDHVDKKVSIKESKHAFSIKYEMNGLVIKENLLNGDKNVVENSSPFRSTSESQSTIDQSTQLESDVSHISTPRSEKDGSFVSEMNSDFKTDPTKVSVNLMESYEKLNDAVSSPLPHTDFLDSVVSSDSDKPEIDEILQLSDISVMSNSESPGNSMEVNPNPSLDIQNIKSVEVVEINEALDMDHELISDVVINDDVDVYNAADMEQSIENENDFKVSEGNTENSEMEREIDKPEDEFSVNSPPTLEKVDSCDASTDVSVKLPEIDKNISVDGSPPVLELVEVDEKEICFNRTENTEKLEVDVEQAEELDTKKNILPERHFLDVLGSVFEKSAESLSLPEKLVSDLPSIEISKSIFSQELTDPDVTKKMDDSIGRHFSDVIVDTVEEKEPLTLQSLLDISEKGEVTLAQIKQILSPESNKGHNTEIPKESLLKIKSSIANLLTSVKKPIKKDPAWLKRDSLSMFALKKTKKQQRHANHDTGEYSYTDDDCTNDDSNTSSSESDKDSELDSTISYETCMHDKSNSKGSVTDNILQMLTSLEDKGSLAGNMTNLLDILAENLVFFGSNNERRSFGDDSTVDSDSDHSYSDDIVPVPTSTSTESTQKELIADYLGEEDQPPAIDDIPIAADHLGSETFEEGKYLNGFSENQCNIDNVTEVSSELVSDKYSSKSPNLENEIHENEVSNTTELESGNVSKSNENMCLNCDKPKTNKQMEPKVNASTIFKSITELNSIETDEESNCGEAFDPITMSARLSELKDNSAWEFNSDYNSDKEIEGLNESDVETDKSTNDTAELRETAIDEVNMKDNILETENFTSGLINIKNKNNNSENTLTNSNIDSLSTSDLDDCSITALSRDVELPALNYMKDSIINSTEVVENNKNKESVIMEVSSGVENSNDKLADQNVHSPVLTDSVWKTDEIGSDQDLPDLRNDSCSNHVSVKQVIECVNDEQDSALDSYEDNKTKCAEHAATDLNEDVSVLEHFDTCKADRTPYSALSESSQDSKEDKLPPDEEYEHYNLVPIVSSHFVEHNETSTLKNSEYSVSNDQNEDSNVTMTYEESDNNFEFPSSLKPKESEMFVHNEYNELDNASQKENRSLKSSKTELNQEHVECNDAIEEKPIEIKDYSIEFTKECASKLEDGYTCTHFENQVDAGSFCETIAEKVKRKQRGRCKSVSYNFDPLLYYSYSYDKEITKPAKKEFSVFRSSILEKRARERYLNECTENYDCSSRKKRYSSVPKDMHSNEHIDFKNTCNNKVRNFKYKELSNQETNADRDVKPCYVALHRLPKRVIEEHTNRKRKCLEDAEPECRPPIKVTIKLSQIIYPPNSPYGSTSVSSDACRSGYESNSENSDSDDECNENDCELNSSELHQSSDNIFESKAVEKNVDIIEREPLKIKMRTLLTKINHDCEGENAGNLKNIGSQNEESVKHLRMSENSDSINAVCNDNSRVWLNNDLNENTKVKPTDVLFYLSDDSDTELDSVKEKITKIVDNDMVSHKEIPFSDSVDNFIHGDCGESDVDLSASDSDSDVQEQIDSILKTDSKSNLLHVNNSEMSSPEEKVCEKPAMKMIVSDLRLSESESDSENEITETISDIIMKDHPEPSKNNVPYPVSGIIMAPQRDNIFEIVKNADDSFEKYSELQNKSPITVSVNISQEVDESDEEVKNEKESVLIAGPQQSQTEQHNEIENVHKCDSPSSAEDNSVKTQDASNVQTLCQSNPEDIDLKEMVPSIDPDNSLIFEQDTADYRNIDSNTDNDLKISDSEDAVKSLERETFQITKSDVEDPEDDLIYYAVEVSDEFETNEAVVNLESVELEQGQVVIDETLSDLNVVNAVETRVLHSEVSNELEVPEETLNEEVVGNSHELKEMDSFESKLCQVDIDKQIDTPVFFPTVNEIKSKYLYGINEDSQSSNEIVEELIMDNIEHSEVLIDTEPVTMKHFDKPMDENHLIEPMDQSESIETCEIETSQEINDHFDISLQHLSEMHGNMNVTMTEVSDCVETFGDSYS